MTSAERPWHWASFWGVGGYLFLLSQAIYRLTPKALEAIEDGMTTWQWGLWALFLVFMIYSEGYKGFVTQVAPRISARAMTLVTDPNPLRRVLAPLFCMGYFHTTRRRLLTTYLLTAGIVLLILVYHNLPQPWRGILDVGVVVGLTWGILSIVAFSAKAFGRSDFDASPELPQTQ